MNFIEDLNAFASYCEKGNLAVRHVVIDVIYRGLAITCRGSKRWRAQRDEMQQFGTPGEDH